MSVETDSREFDRVIIGREGGQIPSERGREIKMELVRGNKGVYVAR